MNPIDLTSLILLALLGILGFWSGLIKAVFRLLAVVAAVAITWFATNPTAAYLSTWFKDAENTLTISFGILFFLGTLMLVLTIGNVLHDFSQKNNFGTFNRLFGLGLGFFKASLIIYTLLSIYSLIPQEMGLNDWKNDSKAWSIFKTSAPKLLKNLEGN
jgi:uncharacterized membrane protein required for colicin V production